MLDRRGFRWRDVPLLFTIEGGKGPLAYPIERGEKKEKREKQGIGCLQTRSAPRKKET